MALRVLYVSDGKLGTTGIDLVTRQQLLALSDAGHEVDLVARGSIDLSGVRFVGQRLPPSKIFSWLPAPYYYGLNKRYFSWFGARHIRHGHYDIVVAWSKTAMHMFEAAKRRGARCILNAGNFHCDFSTGHNTAPKTWPAIDKQRLRNEYELADRILLPSDYSARTFLEAGIPEKKLRIIYRGVDTERFCPGTRLPGGPFVVAMCGRVTERKGAQQILRVWREAALSNAELWLIGAVAPEEKDELERLATQNVRFLGFRRDVPELLRQAHVHVLLSRHEGLAKSLLEAEASGVVNICTPECGLPARPWRILIGDREDTAGVAKALATLKNNPERCLAMGHEARQQVVREFSWQDFRKRFLDALT